MVEDQAGAPLHELDGGAPGHRRSLDARVLVALAIAVTLVAAMVAAIEAKVMPLLREGRVKPLMDSSFPLEKAADAHRRMETSAHIGKIVLAV